MKKSNKEQSRCYVFSLIISLYIVFISFFLERLWFDMDSLKNHFMIYTVSKILLFGLSFMMCFSFQKLKKNGYLSFFVGYTGIMWIMLLLVWPGVWRWDEFWILDGSRYFIPNSYQHWLTSVLYIASLMILPFPTGVIIVQILLISFLVSFIIKTINENFLHLSNWTKWILLIPFLLFPVIDSNLYPVRCSLYAFAELAFITFLINEIFNRKRDPEYMITPNATGIFCCLSILLAVWRSESIYYLVLAPILYMLIFKGKTQKINLLLLIGVMGGGSLFGIKYQNKLLYESIGDQNTVIITLPYIEYALHNEVLSEEDTILEEINRVIDLKLLCDEGKGVIWDSSKNLIRKDYTKTEYRRYLFSYIKLIFMYPQDFLRVQIPVVLQANGMCSSGQFIESTENLYTNEGNYSTETIGEVFFRHDFTRPVSVNLRKNVITILETLEVNKFLWLLHKITYNAFIPILGLIFIIVWCFRKKLYLISGILCSSLIKIPILILSIPGTAFMYWYPNYLVAWTVVIIFLIYQLKHIINIRKEKHKNEQ